MKSKRKLSLGQMLLLSAAPVLLLAFLFLVWPVLNQEGRPFETTLALLQLTLDGSPYIRISEQPEMYIYQDRGREEIFQAKGLVFEEQFGAMILLSQAGERRCAWVRSLTRRYGVLEFDTECRPES